MILAAVTCSSLSPSSLSTRQLELSSRTSLGWRDISWLSGRLCHLVREQQKTPGPEGRGRSTDTGPGPRLLHSAMDMASVTSHKRTCSGGVSRQAEEKPLNELDCLLSTNMSSVV